MENIYERKMPVLISVCGADGKVGLLGALTLFMDTAALHEEVVGFGRRRMQEMGLYWIIGKSRVSFYDPPRLTDEVVVRTWLAPPSKLYVLRQYEIRDLQGKLLVKGETEWLVATEGCKKLLPVRDYISPDYPFFRGSVYEEAFPRLERDFSEESCAGSYRVSPLDIDYIGHMNNTAYVRVFAGTVSNALLAERPIKEAFLCYSRQCLEGDVLRVYKKPAADGFSFGAFAENGINVLTARIVM